MKGAPYVLGLAGAAWYDASMTFLEVLQRGVDRETGGSLLQRGVVTRVLQALGHGKQPVRSVVDGVTTWSWTTEAVGLVTMVEGVVGVATGGQEASEPSSTRSAGDLIDLSEFVTDENREAFETVRAMGIEVFSQMAA